MGKLRLTERVSIDSLVSWPIGFRATEADVDITIPPNVQNYSQLTLAEINGQVKVGNKFFVGKDGCGNNADIRINDPEVVSFVFGAAPEEQKEQILLTLDSVKNLLEVSPAQKFEEALNKLVATESEKKMIISLATQAGIENVEAYKKTMIEKVSGYKFA